MLKKIISKLRVEYQKRALCKIAHSSLSFDMLEAPLASFSLAKDQNVKIHEAVFKNISSGTYELIVASKEKFDQKSFYVSFDISEVIRIESKQLRLVNTKYSADYGIHSFFEEINSNNGIFYGKLTIIIPRFIKYLHVAFHNFEENIQQLHFVNVDSFQYKNIKHELFKVKLDNHDNLEWKKTDVHPGSSIDISVSCKYENTLIDNKKGILLCKIYDHDGKEIKENLLGHIGYSRQYDSFFKYIPNTNFNQQIIFSFLVDQRISFIEIAQTEFNLKNNEKIIFNDFMITSRSQTRSNILEIKDLQLLKNKEVVKYSKSIDGGQYLQCVARIKYENIELLDKKSLLLLTFYDEYNNKLSVSPKNLLWIDKFSSYYKYLADTCNSEVLVYDCEIPKNARSVQIGFTGFNLKSEESVIIETLKLQYKVQPTFLKPIGLDCEKYIPPSAQECEISISGWDEDINELKPTIMGIMDEFTQGCFGADVNLIQPRTDNWYALSEKYDPILMFIESAWKGNSGNWQYRVSRYNNKPGNEVAQLCSFFKNKSIPTIFWNKEDPVHHDRFMESASLAEYIFTTDENMIPSYKSKTGNANVYVLPFAAQPSLHKPCSLTYRKNKSCFAGSWYGNRHAERGEVIVWLLDAAKKYGLDIYDRNYSLGHSPFPDKYQQNVIGSLPYLELCEEYKKYRVFLNVNSVTNSPTMFSRRVFELMACGTPIVSTYSQGIKELFESDAVWLVDSKKEAYKAIEVLMTDDNEWRRRSLLGIREIFQKHTYAHRLNYIFEKTGIDQNIPVIPKVTIFIFIDDQADIDLANTFCRTQIYSNYELILVKSDQYKDYEIQEVQSISQNELITYIANHKSDLYGLISSSYTYSKYYLVDLTNAFIYEPLASSYSVQAQEKTLSPFEYHNYQALNGSLLKNKSEFMGQVRRMLLKQSLQTYRTYFIDSDELVRKNNYVGQNND